MRSPKTYRVILSSSKMLKTFLSFLSLIQHSETLRRISSMNKTVSVVDVTTLRFLCVFLFLFSLQAESIELDKLFSGDRIIYQQNNIDQQYRLTLGQLKKINGVLTTEHEQLITGKLERRTIEVTSYFRLALAWSHINQVLNEYNPRLLFECEGLDCGSSNDWANRRFKIKQLYGLDQSQHYAAWRFSSENRYYFLAAYLVKRGNKRIYVQFDLVETQEPIDVIPDVSIVQEALLQEGFFILPGLNFTEEELEVSTATAELIVKLLANLRRYDFYVVGHSYRKQTLQEQKNDSLDYAKQFIERMESLGARKSQLEPKGIGSLSPEHKNGESLVLINKSHIFGSE